MTTKSRSGVAVAALLLFASLSGCGGGGESGKVVHKVVDPDSVGAKVMLKHCGSCHAPPKATDHIAEEWPNVVYRMAEKLRLKGHIPMTEQEKSDLVAYLQQHSNG